MTNIEKIKADDVEVVNSNASEEKPKITKIKADENASAKNPFEEMIKKMQGQGGGFGTAGGENNPLMGMMGNIEEIKKIKAYFFVSIICGIIGLFTLREFFGPIAILAGVADLYLGSKLTQTPAKFGIFLGLVDLILYFS